jgi:hypothetical protein
MTEATDTTNDDDAGEELEPDATPDTNIPPDEDAQEELANE